jgi:hypothetical protein
MRFNTYMAGALTAVALSLPANAWAMSADQINKGFANCIQWCTDHNKTTASRNKCDIQCDHYWYHVVKQPGPIARNDQ